MLFTDGTILTIQELREHDNFVLDVASTELIELSSKLAVAQREIGYEIQSFLTPRYTGSELNRVVVNQQLKDLVAAHTLSMIYRDAYNMHLNDRYLGRWKEFARASERGLLRLFQNGIGLAAIAVAQASKPDVTASPDGGLSSGVYVVQTAWEHLTGTIGEKSAPVLIDCAGGSLIVTAGTQPMNAIGWHAFLAVQDSAPARQNQAPIAPGSPWIQGAELRNDLAGPETSGPDYYVRNSGQLSRG
jgi:hypothetical protein